jgi:UDP-N-acetyl-D-galactosamine dehydrogenase
VTVLGLTFKENCPDIRNSRVIDIIRELQDYGINVQVHDPLADPDEVEHEYGLSIIPFADLKPASAIVIAVAHLQYRDMEIEIYRSLLGGSVLVDVKGIFDPVTVQDGGIRLWRL